MKQFLLLLALLPALLQAGQPEKVYSAKYHKHFYLGLKKHAKTTATPSTLFKAADVKVPIDFFMPSKWPLPAGLPYDQGQCGSCVVNSINGNATYGLSIRGLLANQFSPLSRGQTMNCNPSAGQCGGDWAENVGGWVGKRGHLLPESVYGYRPSNGDCRNLSGTEYGPIPTGMVIDNSPESMGKALVSGVPVSITVGAGGAWMNYESGTFKSCSNVGTNHEVLLIGIHCKNAAAGADGFCNFAAARPGDIEYDILNSWGLWGDEGRIRTVALDSSGRRCNNVAEEAYAFGFAPVDDKPPTCSLKIEKQDYKAGETVKVAFSSENAKTASVDGQPVSVPTATVSVTAPGVPGFFVVNGKVLSPSGKEGVCAVNYTVLPSDSGGGSIPGMAWVILAGLGLVALIVFLLKR